MIPSVRSHLFAKQAPQNQYLKKQVVVNYLKEYVRWLKLNHKTQSQFLVSTEGPCAGCAEYPTRTIKCFEKGGKQKKMCITDEWDPKWNRFKWKQDLPLSKKLLQNPNITGDIKASMKDSKVIFDCPSH